MIGAVVLAAGRGRRFGYAPKLLARFNGVALIRHVLCAVNHAPVHPVVLVTGRRHATMAGIGRRCIRPRGRLRIVRNQSYAKGMAHSLRLGIRALPTRCDAALICLADMPLIDTATIARLCAAWHSRLDCVRPVHAGRPGHPVLISSAVFDEVAALRGDQGARTVLWQVPPARRRLLSGSAASVADIDTPATLRRVRTMARQRRRRAWRRPAHMRRQIACAPAHARFIAHGLPNTQNSNPSPFIQRYPQDTVFGRG